MTWQHSADGGNQIRARRVSTAGDLLGGQIELEASGSDLYPAISHDTSGNYLRVFMYDEFPDEFGVWGQRLTSAGSLIGDEFENLQRGDKLQRARRGLQFAQRRVSGRLA